MWDHRVVIPSKARPRMLEVLHEGHPGISKAKALARGYIWWPKIDGDLERAVRSCVQCQEYSWMLCSSSATPLGIANPTMVTITCGLCRTVYGQDATGDS